LYRFEELICFDEKYWAVTETSRETSSRQKGKAQEVFFFILSWNFPQEAVLWSFCRRLQKEYAAYFFLSKKRMSPGTMRHTHAGHKQCAYISAIEFIIVQRQFSFWIFLKTNRFFKFLFPTVANLRLTKDGESMRFSEIELVLILILMLLLVYTI